MGVYILGFQRLRFNAMWLFEF